MSFKYTEGNEFFKKDDTEYIGYYHQVRGRYYTGKRHVYRQSKQIFKKTFQEDNFFEHALKFKPIIEDLKIDWNDVKLINYPLSQLDQQTSSIYIIQLKSDNSFYEVDQTTFKIFKKHPLFNTISFKIKNDTQHFLSTIYNRNQLLKNVRDYRIREYLIKHRGI